MLAAVFSAMEDVPKRLALLERATVENTAKLESIRAALPPHHLTVSEAASALKVSIPTMRRWVRRGEVPTLKIGHTVRVDLSRLHGTDATTIAQRANAARSHDSRSEPTT